ncbi:hypothetical protein DFJ74DRAFT_413616 [Hyaloraphidium curvatum]|nr:hypothetical protein DFJ74DRAFT_413616 [Hyaloraphidium curvatum]
MPSPLHRGQNAASCLRLASAALQGIRVSGDAGLASGMLHWAGLDKPAESLGEAYYEMRCFRLLSVLRVHDRASHGGVPIPANTNAGKIERAVKSAAQAHATQFNCDELDATDETICLPFASETALWTDASASQLYDQLFRDELSFADAFNRQGYTLPVVPTAPWTSADLWERRELHRLLQEVSRRAPFSISILLQTPPPALSVPFMRSIISSIARQLQSSTSFRVCFGLGKLLLRLIRSSGQLEAEDWQIAFTACFSFAGGLSGFGLLSDAEQTDLIEMWTQLASWLARVALDSSGGTDELESPLFGALTSLADKPDDLLRSPVGTSALAAVCHIIATWIAKHSPEVLDLRALRDALQRLHRATLRKPEIIRDNYYAVIKLLWQLTLLDYSFAVMEPSKVLQCVRLTFGYLESCCQRQLGATTVINGVSAAKSIGEISLVLQQWLSHAGILGHNLSVEDTLDLMFNAELCCESDGESWSSRMVPALGALLDSYGMDRVFDGVVDILERRSTRPDGRAPALATLVGLFGLGSKSPAGRKSLRAYQRAARTLDIVQGIGVSSKTGPRTAPLLVSLLDCVVRARVRIALRDEVWNHTDVATSARTDAARRTGFSAVYCRGSGRKIPLLHYLGCAVNRIGTPRRCPPDTSFAGGDPRQCVSSEIRHFGGSRRRRSACITVHVA